MMTFAVRVSKIPVVIGTASVAPYEFDMLGHRNAVQQSLRCSIRMVVAPISTFRKDDVSVDASDG